MTLKRESNGTGRVQDDACTKGGADDFLLALLFERDVDLFAYFEQFAPRLDNGRVVEFSDLRELLEMNRPRAAAGNVLP